MQKIPSSSAIILILCFTAFFFSTVQATHSSNLPTRLSADTKHSKIKKLLCDMWKKGNFSGSLSTYKGGYLSFLRNKNPDGETPLSYALKENSKYVEAIISAYFYEIYKESISYYYDGYSFIQKSSVDFELDPLDIGFFLMHPEKLTIGPIQYAIKHGYLDIARYLITNKKYQTFINHTGSTNYIPIEQPPLWTAVEQHCNHLTSEKEFLLELIKELLENGADANIPGTNFSRPLDLAINFGKDCSVCRLLIPHTDLSVTDYYRRALVRSKFELAYMLVPQWKSNQSDRMTLLDYLTHLNYHNDDAQKAHFLYELTKTAGIFWAFTVIETGWADLNIKHQGEFWWKETIDRCKEHLPFICQKTRKCEPTLKTFLRLQELSKNFNQYPELSPYLKEIDKCLSLEK